MLREVRGYAAADALAQAMGAEAPLAAARLGRGCRAFAGWVGEAVAGYGWLSQGPEWIGEVGLQVEPAEGEAYLWNFVTLPAHRRRGIFRALVVEACAAAADEGLTRLWIGSIAGTAEQAVVEAGFRPALSIVGGSAVVEDGDLGTAGCDVLGVTPGRPVRPGSPRRH